MPVRFWWNATRGNRLTPWRSEYIKWRIETYSGRKADTIDAAYFWFFLWKERAQLMRFLAWARNFGTREPATPLNLFNLLRPALLIACTVFLCLEAHGGQAASPRPQSGCRPQKC